MSREIRIDLESLFNVSDGIVRGVESRADPNNFTMDIGYFFRRQCRFPHLHFIDYTIEVIVPRSIDSKFVNLNAVYRTIGDTLIQDFDTVHVQSDGVVFKRGN